MAVVIPEAAEVVAVDIPEAEAVVTLVEAEAAGEVTLHSLRKNSLRPCSV